MTGRLATILCAVFFGSACNQQAAFDRFVPQEESAFGRRVFEQLQRREFREVEALLNPDLAVSARVGTELEQLASLFPTEAPVSVRVIGAVTNIVNGTRRVHLTYEYEYQKQWVVASIVLRQASGRQVIDGLHAQPARDAQARINAFTLFGKDARHYAMLTWAVAVPLFIAVTLAVFLKTRVPRRRWLWAITIVLGVGQVAFNWTTAEVSVQAIQVVLLGSGFFKAGPYGPLTLVCSVPVGALAFWWKRRQWVANHPAAA